jgi:hypothetical protein
MSVEQTTQLIQLILNSVLMTVACTLLLSRITMRQTALEEQLHAANRQCLELLGVSSEQWRDGVGSDRIGDLPKRGLQPWQWDTVIARSQAIDS